MMIVQNQKGTSDKWEMFIEQTRIFSKQEIFTEDLKTKQKIEVQKMNEVQMPYFKEIKEETVEMTDEYVSLDIFTISII